MSRYTPLPLLLLLLLALAAVPACTAYTPCPNPTTSDENTCSTSTAGVANTCHFAAGTTQACVDGPYPLLCTNPNYVSPGEVACDSVGTCMWNYDYNACLNNPAPVTCESFGSDSAACASDLECTFNTLNSRCYQPPPECAGLASIMCSKRSDCTYTGSMCTATAQACGSHTTGGACAAAGCFWDYYTTTATTTTSSGGQCFFNLQEVNQLFQCSHWSNYPSTEACAYHGCGSTGSTCHIVTNTGVETGGSVSVEVEYGVRDAAVTSSALGFTAQVIIPLSQFWRPSQPVFHAVVIGDVTAETLHRYTTAGPCTSVKTTFPLESASVPSANADLTALYNEFLNHVNVNGNLQFASADIRAIVGEWATGPLVTSASILDGNSNIGLGVSGVLANWASQCNITRVSTGSYTTYDVPIAILWRSADGTIRPTPSRFFVSISTAGTVQISATSKAILAATLEDVAAVQDVCPSGQKRRTWSVNLSFKNAFDTSQVIGLRSTADITMQTGATLNNCFGSEVTSVVPPTACPGFVCTTVVSFRTRCTPIPENGSGLNLCANQLASARHSDLGLDGTPGLGFDTPYPSNLDYHQTFYIKPHSWSQSVGVTDVNAQPAGSDPTGVAWDEVPVSISLQVYPTEDIQLELIVRGGVLPTPTSPFSERLQLGSSTGVNNTLDARNAQLYFTQSLTPLVWLDKADERETYLLHLNLPSIRFYALSSTGVQLALPPLTWEQLRPFAQYSPRNDVCPTCTLLPVVQQLSGTDGFSEPVKLLRVLLPANGYRMEVGYNVTLPQGAALPDASPARRRMLQDQVSATFVRSGVFSMQWIFSLNGTEAVMVDSTQGWDLGPTHDSTKSSLGVSIGVSAAILTVVTTMVYAIKS